MTHARLSPGTVFAREFRVVRPLAEGGMGAVYVVEQLSTSEQRALKLMSPRLMTDVRAVQRFDQEARIAARIPSVHVVRVISAGVEADTGTPWLCMELLHGRDLADVLAARGRLPPAEVATLFEQLCHALELAHRAGIVHRDLKPENLFVAEPQSPGVPFTLKVLDFGIARICEEVRRTSILTEGIGTPLWMAPEQCAASSHIGPQTDVWALGLIAFALLTGRTYWVHGGDPSAAIGLVLQEILEGEIAPPSRRVAELGVPVRLPPGFDAWFLRCVARDPAARFAHAGEARDALRPLLAASAQADAAWTGPTAWAATSPAMIASLPTIAAPQSAPSQPSPTAGTPSARATNAATNWTSATAAAPATTTAAPAHPTASQRFVPVAYPTAQGAPPWSNAPASGRVAPERRRPRTGLIIGGVVGVVALAAVVAIVALTAGDGASDGASASTPSQAGAGVMTSGPPSPAPTSVGATPTSSCWLVAQPSSPGVAPALRNQQVITTAAIRDGVVTVGCVIPSTETQVVLHVPAAATPRARFPLSLASEVAVLFASTRAPGGPAMAARQRATRGMVQVNRLEAHPGGRVEVGFFAAFPNSAAPRGEAEFQGFISTVIGEAN